MEDKLKRRKRRKKKRNKNKQMKNHNNSNKLLKHKQMARLPQHKRIKIYNIV